MLFHIRQHAQKVTVDFMRVVNQSPREGGLTYSFVDKEITQFTQIQEASGQAPQEICCTSDNRLHQNVLAGTWVQVVP